MLGNYSAYLKPYTAATRRISSSQLGSRLFTSASFIAPYTGNVIPTYNRSSFLSLTGRRHKTDNLQVSSTAQNATAEDRPQTSSVLTVTQRASDRFKYLLQRRNMEKGAVQLSVRKKGCAGMSYIMDFYKSPNVTMGNGKSAVLVTQNDEYSLLVDGESLGYLLGCEIDWVEGDISSQFVFKNPNASRNCSCGRSFAT